MEDDLNMQRIITGPANAAKGKPKAQKMPAIDQNYESFNK
jgi:hypothetical protein